MPSARRVLIVSTALWLSVFCVIALGVAWTDKASRSATVKDPCGSLDLSVQAHYPVSGYWIFPEKDRCDTRKTLQSIHRIGGDTVITSGARLEPRQVDIDGRMLTRSGAVDPTFRDCRQNGRTCYQAAFDTLRSGNPGNSIVQTYALPTNEQLTASLLRCPGRDSRVVIGTRVFHRILLLADDPASSSCDMSQGRPYRLVLIAGSTTDWLADTLSEADRFGMKAFVGMPAFPSHPGRTWNIDPVHQATALAVSRLILQDYAKRFGGHSSFIGLYQTFELRLRDWPHPAEDPNLQAYAAQHSLAREATPAKKILVSPYWDTRRRLNDETGPAAIEAGIKAIAGTDVDIIAPQDGRGTGKVGFFWGHQARDPVDPRLRSVEGVGDSSYQEAYTQETTEYYAASARARDDLARRQGRPIELWANAEAFEPAATTLCDAYTARGRTDKARLDQALMFAGSHVSKVVSFKWNGLYTCRAGHPMSLSEEISADWERPILGGATRSSSDGRDGLLIRGYQLKDSTVTLTWYDTGSIPRSSRISVAKEGRYDPAAGRRNPLLPQFMEEVWVPFPWTDMAQASWLHIDIINATGRSATNRFSLHHR